MITVTRSKEDNERVAVGNNYANITLSFVFEISDQLDFDFGEYSSTATLIAAGIGDERFAEALKKVAQEILETN